MRQPCRDFEVMAIIDPRKIPFRPQSSGSLFIVFDMSNENCFQQDKTQKVLSRTTLFRPLFEQHRDRGKFVSHQFERTPEYM